MIKNVLKFYTKYFPAWVVLACIWAYFQPAVFLGLSRFNKHFFFLTMFGIGAVLTLDDFRRIAAKPSIVLVGTIAQFTIMPLGAFLVSKIFHLPPYMAIGLILAGCAPGAMSSNVMSYIAKADTAYSVSLTTASTLLCPVLTPALTTFWATLLVTGTSFSFEVKGIDMFVELVLIVILPIIIGFLLRSVLKEKIAKIEPVFPAISVTFIIFICALVMAGNRTSLDSSMHGLFIILIAVTCLNIYGMASGYGVGMLFRMEKKRKRTLSIEIGMQNAGLGTMLAIEHFGKEAAIPTAMFVFVCIFTASVMADVWRRIDLAQSDWPPGSDLDN